MEVAEGLRVIRGGAPSPSEAATRPLRSLADDAYRIAREWWGKPRAEWVLLLGEELLSRSPAVLRRHRRRSWIAAILVAAAIAEGMHRRPERWELVLDDIEETTGVGRGTAFACWRQLARLGLTRPTRPPAYWDDGWDCPAPPDLTTAGSTRRLAVVPMT